MRRLGEWNPKPGTLPGRTEMRVLRAMQSLADAGAEEAHLGAIYGFVDQFGHPTLKEYDFKWQLRTFMLKHGYDISYRLRDIPFEKRRFEHKTNPFSAQTGRGHASMTQDEALEWATGRGFVAAWSPHESTVDKRLRDLQTRGYVEKIRPAIWRMTKEGKQLMKRLALWTEGEVYA